MKIEDETMEIDANDGGKAVGVLGDGNEVHN